MHLTPAGFPLGMPGIGEEIEGAIQQAPQFGRQSIFYRKNKNIHNQTQIILTNLQSFTIDVYKYHLS
jgi:hypothetical protein